MFKKIFFDQIAAILESAATATLKKTKTKDLNIPGTVKSKNVEIIVKGNEC